MNKNYDILDLTKYILSIFVVAIHSRLGFCAPHLFPWLRLAVPMFFIISSFFVFSKVQGMDSNSGWKIINRTAKRLLTLYLFWLVVQLPYVVNYRQGWFGLGVPFGLYNTFMHTILSSTFPASWFIVATIESLYLIYFFRVFKGGRFRKAFSFVPLVLYLFCCFWSCYSDLPMPVKGLNSFMRQFVVYVCKPSHCFLVALLWVQAGALIADGKIRLGRKWLLLIAVASGVLLFFESKFVRGLVGGRDCECYVFLIPLAISLFLLIKDVDVSLKSAPTLRKISVITYCSHCCVYYLIGFLSIFQSVNWPMATVLVVKFSLTLLICNLLALLLIKLENRPHFKWLRYSH